MKRCVAFLAITSLLGWAAGAHAQATVDVGEKEKAAAKKYAEDILSAYTKSEHARFVDLVYPEVLDRVGGRDKLIALMKAVDERMQATGWSYGTATVDKPGRFARMGKVLVTTLPYTVEYVGPGTKRKDTSYLIGFSTDDGKSWKFADGRKVTRENVKDIFPNFPDSIELPRGKDK